MSALICVAVRGVLYTRISSILPLNHSPQTEVPPMRRAPELVIIEPLTALVPTATPLTYSVTVEPLNVAARCDHWPVVSAALPRVTSSLLVNTSTLGLPVSREPYRP